MAKVSGIGQTLTTVEGKNNWQAAAVFSENENI